jgi:hypothetical protein
MRGMTYKSASRRAQRALLAIGAGLTLAVAAAPVAQATPAKASASADGTCVANANGTINSDGTSAGATNACPGGTVADNAGGKGKGRGDGGGGDTGHKVG